MFFLARVREPPTNDVETSRRRVRTVAGNDTEKAA